MNSGKEIMNCPWIEVWGLPAACLLYSVFLNNKTGYIRFYIIVSVFPRTIILIYLHTSPPHLILDLVISSTVCLLTAYAIYAIVCVSLCTVYQLLFQYICSHQHWNCAQPASLTWTFSYCIYDSPPFFINKVFRIIQSHTYNFIIISH